MKSRIHFAENWVQFQHNYLTHRLYQKGLPNLHLAVNHYARLYRLEEINQ